MKDRVTTIVSTILEKLGIQHEGIEEKHIAGQTLYCIVTDESGTLIGQRGDVLRSLNTIVDHLLEQELGERIKVTVDVNDYKKSKIDKIIQEAHVLAQRARDLRYDVEMQPANGYERMLVHASLADDPELETGSIGEGTSRRVVIKWVG